MLNFQTLQHRRDVAGHTALVMVQDKHIGHVQELRQPQSQAQATLQAVVLGLSELLQPSVGWWNTLLVTQTDSEGATLQLVND